MYYSLLSRIKNAQAARKETVQTPFSNMDFAAAKILVQTGYLKDTQKKIVDDKSVLEVRLAYHNKKPGLTDFKIISKPSRRIYTGYRDLKPVRHNFGVAVLSTPQGLMSNKEARKNKVGGEYLFQVW